MHDLTFPHQEVKEKINEHFQKLNLQRENNAETFSRTADETKVHGKSSKLVLPGKNIPDRNTDVKTVLAPKRVKLTQLSCDAEQASYQPAAEIPTTAKGPSVVTISDQIETENTRTEKIQVAEEPAAPMTPVPNEYDIHEYSDETKVQKDLEETQIQIKQITGNILQIPENEINVDDAFKELGVDSIIGVEIIRDINVKYGLTLEAIELYDYPTIEKMAGRVFEKLEHSKCVGATSQQSGSVPETTAKDGEQTDNDNNDGLDGLEELLKSFQEGRLDRGMLKHNLEEML